MKSPRFLPDVPPALLCLEAFSFPACPLWRSGVAPPFVPSGSMQGQEQKNYRGNAPLGDCDRSGAGSQALLPDRKHLTSSPYKNIPCYVQLVKPFRTCIQVCQQVSGAAPVSFPPAEEPPFSRAAAMPKRTQKRNPTLCLAAKMLPPMP